MEVSLLPERFGSDDLRVLSKYEQAPQGAWTTMPQADKDSYLRIHTRLEEILQGYSDGAARWRLV